MFWLVTNCGANACVVFSAYGASLTSKLKRDISVQALGLSCRAYVVVIDVGPLPTTFFSGQKLIYKYNI